MDSGIEPITPDDESESPARIALGLTEQQTHSVHLKQVVTHLLIKKQETFP